jgi:hypothetical protein
MEALTFSPRHSVPAFPKPMDQAAPLPVASMVLYVIISSLILVIHDNMINEINHIV